MREKGAIGNRPRRAIGQAGLFSAIGVASITPRIWMLALASEGGANQHSPALPRARPSRTMGRAPARRRQREAEHLAPGARARHTGGTFSQRIPADYPR
jgi:hypothetical protein